MTGKYSWQDPTRTNYLDLEELTARHTKRVSTYVSPLKMAAEKDLALTPREAQRLPEGVAKEDLSDLTQMSSEIAQLEEELKVLQSLRRGKIKALREAGMSINWLAERGGLSRPGVHSILNGSGKRG